MQKRGIFLNLGYLFFSFFLFLTFFPPKAYAYLDPGTGSYVLQILFGGLFGVAFLVKSFWKDIKGFFEKIKEKLPKRKAGEPEDGKP
jgi:hypothetical protein